MNKKPVVALCVASILGTEIGDKGYRHGHHLAQPEHFHTEIPEDVSHNFAGRIQIDSSAVAARIDTGTLRMLKNAG